MDPEEAAPVQPDDSASPRSFSQDELNAILAEDRRKNAARFADYDELRTKAKAFDDAEEASKSELQKLQDQLAAAQRDAQTATLGALRANVAQSKGVPADLLSGSSEEDLIASADRLIAFRGALPTGSPAAGVQGNVGDPIGKQQGQKSRVDLASMTPAQIVAARKAGELNDLLSGN